MNTKEFWTAGEKQDLLNLYIELRKQFPLPFCGNKYRLLKDVIFSALVNENVERTFLGQNPLVFSIQTALLITREIGCNVETVQACLLYPYFNSTDALKNISSTFNPRVEAILEGLINIQKLYEKSPSIENDNFRNLLVSFAKDMSVILIMIANRTLMMRILSDNDSEEIQTKMSSEAIYLYAPLAHKLGLYKLKSELEDLSLKYLNHEAYYHIKEKLNATKDARDLYMTQFMEPIRELLDAANLKYTMKGRTKSIYSIWQKMKRQGCAFEGVYDLFAIRIILDSPQELEKQQCWQVYSILTDKYRPNPKRLRDWLSIPKSNGYESLHITVLGPDNKWIEVQIRTRRMDDIAEHGFAAHWRYKGIKGDDKGVENWLSNIRSALEASDDLQVMDHFKSELKEDEVYVFTPAGDLHKLPLGASVLDFAYEIHTNIGMHCTGAIVNSKNVPIHHVLNSGDQVSILTSQNQLPKQGWLNYVITGKAKTKIRQNLKEQEVKQVGLAKEILERKFKNRKIEFDGNLMIQVAKKLGHKDVNYLYKAVVDENIDVNHVIDTYQELTKRDAGLLDRAPIHSAEEFSLKEELIADNNKSDDVLVIDKQLKGVAYSLSHCCNPIYGDKVFAFITASNGLKIHREDCPNASALRERFGYRIVKAKWSGTGENTSYPITLRIVGTDDLGVVNNISSVVSKDEKIYIRSFSISANDGLFSGALTIMINNNRSLENLMKKLRTIKGVKNVSRN